MSTASARVRAGHDGNHFHVLWAARRALELLSPESDLVAVVVEGPSPREDGDDPVEAGEEVIDVAEYRGSERLADATRIDYIQLKHSTLREDDVWTASGLTTTLRGWGRRLTGHAAGGDVVALLARFRFRFVSNRPIADAVLESIADLAAGRQPRHPETASALVRAAGLDASLTAAFFARVDLTGREARFTVQDRLLAAELRTLVVESEAAPALALKNLFYEKLGSGPADNVVRSSDVLVALNIDPAQLLPAEPQIDVLPDAVPREQEEDLHRRIRTAAGPLVITAEGGVGKSIVATRLHLGLPDGSASVLYDCYGRGDYRREPRERHAYRVALTQMANTLAVRGLCMPLLPGRAHDAAYLSAFLKRLDTAARRLREAAPDALLLVIVDAADNAMMGAKGSAEPAFVPGLLGAPLPAGVRLVLLCRPERFDLLGAPPGLEPLPLRPFSHAETARHLRGLYPEATDADIVEFDYRTSSNPRVQANAFTAASLREVLQALGPDPQSVSSIIAAQLEAALNEVRAEAEDHLAVDDMCSGLATLRPLIPLDILARLAQVDVARVRSFAHDFGKGRWLLLAGDGVQFRDEPVEDWFRGRYAATPGALARFAERLAPLADQSAYVAATLPALWLQAERPDRLTALALSTERLPADSPLERRDVEAMRVQFALRAALKAARFADAARLILKAGDVAAGSGLQDRLLRDQTDIFGRCLDARRIQDIGARRLLGGWVGARYTAEAALFSQKAELEGEARSRLRSAEDLLRAWSGLAPADQEAKPYQTPDQVDHAFAVLNLEGPERAVREITRWRPKEIWFETARALADRLIDHGRLDEAGTMAAFAAQKAHPLAAGICSALGALDLPLPRTAVEALVGRRTDRRPSDAGRRTVWDRSSGTVTRLVEGAVRLGGFDRAALARRLDKVLPNDPPRVLASQQAEPRTRHLRTRTLRDALRGTPTALDSLRPEGSRRTAAPPATRSDYYEDREFRVRVGAVLPWWAARAECLVEGPVPASRLDALVAEARAATQAAIGHQGDDVGEVQDEIVEIWHDLLVESGHASAARWAALDDWIATLRRPMYLPTWRRLARKAGCRPELADRALHYAGRAGANEWESDAVSARDQIDNHVAAARALLASNEPEAFAHLDRAVEVAGLLGDEVPTRWAALLAFAERARGVSGDAAPETAWRLARVGEFAAGYVEDQFDWSGAVSALTAIHPGSAIAAVSRWRDRNVGVGADLLATLEATLRKSGALDPVAGLALLGFDCDWPVEAMFEAALDAAPGLGGEIVDVVARHAALAHFGPTGRWTLAQIAQRRGLDPRPFGRTQRPQRPRRPRHSGSGRGFWKPPWLPDLARALAARPPRLYADGAALLASLKTRHRSVSRSHAWKLILAAAPSADLPALIEAVLGADEIRPSSVSDLLDAIAPTVRDGLAVQNAFRAGVLDLARRRCWTLRGYGGYRETIDDLAARARLSRDAVVDAVLEGVAEDVRGVVPDDLFSLAPLLADKLTPAEAQAALDFGLRQIETVMPAAFGDGPFMADAAPSESDTAFAGLITVALAAPADRTRWEAAHAARILIQLDRGRVVSALSTLATSRRAKGFSAPSLPYYALNAELWFHIAVARVATERPDRVRSLEPVLQDVAEPANDHVLIRRFAAGSLLALDAAKVIILTPERRHELRDLNTTAKPPKAAQTRGGQDWYGRPSRRSQRRFSFPYELAKGEAGRLAAAFGLSPDQLERKAETIIFQTWRTTEDLKGRDPRAGDPAWSRSDRTGSYQGFRDYLGYHVLFCLAGQLARTTPPLRHPEARRDEFQDWLARFDLTQDDASWTSDRRDTIPDLPDLPELADDEAKALWPWSVRRSDFETALRVGGELVVAGDWHERDGRTEQDVLISSVLVEPATASALLAAYQTIEDPWDYHLPGEEDEAIDHPPYCQRAWVNGHRPEARLDRSDPWIGAMTSAAPRPAAWLARRLRLRSHRHGREWRSSGRGPPLFRSAIWAGPSSQREDDLPPYGARLTVLASRLPALLRRLDMDLLVNVEIRRALRPEWGESRWNDTPAAPYFRLFLFRKDGTVDTL